MDHKRFAGAAMLLICLAAVNFSQSQTQDFEAARARAQKDREDRQREKILEDQRAAMRRLETRRVPGPLRAALYPRSDEAWERRVKELRTVDPAYLREYADFLKQKRTGIMQLLPNFDCLNNNVVRVDNECESFVPETSDYSFRAKKYSYPLLHDIGLNNGRFVTEPYFAHGMIVSLGDLPIAGATLEHPAIKFLKDFPASTDPASARKAAVRISAGMEHAGYRFSDKAAAGPNTYAIRVIAYGLANALPGYHDLDTLPQKKFLQMSYDDRDDVIVAFRVVGRNANGSLTVIWKELQRRDAPELRFAKDETLENIR